MSVINRMLQDLDARQNRAREATHLYTKPAATPGARRLPVVMLLCAALGAAVLVLGGAFAWRYWRNAHVPAAAAPAPARVVIVPAPPRIQALPAAPAQVQTAAAPASVAPTAAAPAVAPPSPRDAASVSAPAAAVVPPSARDAASAPAPVAPAAPPAARNAASASAPAAAPVAPQNKADRPRAEHRKRVPAERASSRHPSRNRPADKSAGARKPQQHEATRAAKHEASSRPATRDDKPVAQGKEDTAAQKAEAAYRRGLASIQEGYLSDGIGALEQALQANPRHEAARQTLVSVLLDARRVDEAMRQLQLALTLDAKQPSMAMLLARLQIEHGGSGIDTLMRTLPYVGANGEYRAFLAGALQRQQRHREAIEQYLAALRSAPQNGVWLMGLGISLQAEKRDAEALDAFRKARASGTLDAQLTAFVDSKIQQLSH